MAENQHIENGSSNKKLLDQADFETKQNLLGFFNLLLEIDKRNNPQDYEKDEDLGSTNNNV